MYKILLSKKLTNMNVSSRRDFEVGNTVWIIYAERRPRYLSGRIECNVSSKCTGWLGLQRVSLVFTVVRFDTVMVKGNLTTFWDVQQEYFVLNFKYFIYLWNSTGFWNKNILVIFLNWIYPSTGYKLDISTFVTRHTGITFVLLSNWKCFICALT